MALDRATSASLLLKPLYDRYVSQSALCPTSETYFYSKTTTTFLKPENQSALCGERALLVTSLPEGAANRVILEFEIKVIIQFEELHVWRSWSLPSQQAGRVMCPPGIIPGDDGANRKFCILDEEWEIWFCKWDRIKIL